MFPSSLSYFLFSSILLQKYLFQILITLFQRDKKSTTLVIIHSYHWNVHVFSRHQHCKLTEWESFWPPRTSSGTCSYLPHPPTLSHSCSLTLSRHPLFHPPHISIRLALTFLSSLLHFSFPQPSYSPPITDTCYWQRLPFVLLCIHDFCPLLKTSLEYVFAGRVRGRFFCL